MMNGLTIAALVIPFFFLVGSVPCGLIIGLLRGVDVRAHGSGNIGAANVGRLLGKKWGFGVFLLDMLKGLMPTLAIGGYLSPTSQTNEWGPWAQWLWVAAGFSLILGHNFSIFLRFRGGKGVATSFGVALGLYPHFLIPALIAFSAWAMCLIATGMSSLGSIAGGILLPLAYFLQIFWQGESIREHWAFAMFALAACAMLLVRHNANLSRILSGTEARFGRREPDIDNTP